MITDEIKEQVRKVGELDIFYFLIFLFSKHVDFSEVKEFQQLLHNFAAEIDDINNSLILFHFVFEHFLEYDRTFHKDILECL